MHFSRSKHNANLPAQIDICECENSISYAESQEHLCKRHLCRMAAQASLHTLAMFTKQQVAQSIDHGIAISNCCGEHRMHTWTSLDDALSCLLYTSDAADE